MRTLYVIPHNTMYLEDTSSVTFRQDETYVFEETFFQDEDCSFVCAKDERNDNPHYADLEWLLDNFEVYEETTTVIEVTQ